MTHRRESTRWLLCPLLAAFCLSAGPPPPTYLTLDKSGKLVYTIESNGDRIPDFSHAGYRGGGVPIPLVPARLILGPVEGDDGVRIQAAIDRVSKLPIGPDGFRGAVLLKSGRYEVGGSIRLPASGVVLRGQGTGAEGSVLVATGHSRRALIKLEGGGRRSFRSKTPPRVTDSYVPVGARRLKLDRVDGLKVGDSVLVRRPGTAAWISAVGMDAFPFGYEGSLNWKPAAMEVKHDRRVEAIDGNRVTLDAPLTVSLSTEFGGGTVEPYDWDMRLERVGIENLRCESEFDSRNPLDEEHAWTAVSLDRVKDAWVRNMTALGFAGSAVRILDDAQRVTIQDCASLEPVSENGGYRRRSFMTSGELTLFLRCVSSEGRNDFAVGALATGPNAFVHCTARDTLGFSGPVESWASGVLYDNVSVDGGGLSLTNREIAGNGVGWAAANCMLWQCSASVVTCRRPPGAHNWAIGCWGQFLGDGEWQATNEFVKPDSLYRAQLIERLGPRASEALDPTAISADPSRADEFKESVVHSVSPPSKAGLRVHEGRLLIGETLLTGERIGTNWWRGSVLPMRAGDFGVGITRFVPGREAPGMTDDLEILTNDMRRDGKTVLSHHWGLWYDRRRDDHQMVRRDSGDVWPPFLEQPWARSGKGRAWDGLSKYDLERFNPWYFDRLDAFAKLCDEKGLVLIHQAYFQHNILEAAAHWADFPWRPANCLQETGFPEPPRHVGGKRVFMADDFYDVTHPVRRALHRAYIRHCLDVLGRRTNVIFFIGEEYTGPLKFMQFWLDVVTEWERENGRDVLVGLSATKDVQDAILQDPVRGAKISVVDLKYWWYFADGTLYAPEGGKNLAPRQQLREWKGPKKGSMEQTVRQIREYRERYPDKALLFGDGPSEGWSVVLAGGSLPKLPREIHPQLLSVLPRLKRISSPAGQLQSADPGRDYLGRADPGRRPSFDLSAEAGSFLAVRIDPTTGKPDSTAIPVKGGAVVELPPADSGPTLYWLRAQPASP